MKIKQMLTQSRRDFTAIMICEHCGHEELDQYGYDDDNYHKNVIPNMVCEHCGEISPTTYQANTTKYGAWEVI